MLYLKSDFFTTFMENWTRQQKLIYIASILDTQANFYIYFDESRSKNCSVAQINFSSIKKDLVYFLRDSVKLGNIQKVKSRVNPVYSLNVIGLQGCSLILDKYSDYFIFNKEKADLMKQFIKANNLVDRQIILENFEALEREKGIAKYL